MSETEKKKKKKRKKKKDLLPSLFYTETILSLGSPSHWTYKDFPKTQRSLNTSLFC